MAGDAIVAAIQREIPDAVITLTDLAGDGDHWAVKVVSPTFAGKPRVMQHKMVYAALKELSDGTLHALAVETSTS